MTEGKHALLAQVLREAGRPVDVPALLASLRPEDVGKPSEPPPTEPLTPRVPFRVTYEYVEFVEGVSRRFLRQTVVEADGLEAARVAALAHFGGLEGHSLVGWRRVLVRYHVDVLGDGLLPS